MLVLSMVNLFATMNAMFIRTFFAVLGLPVVKYWENGIYSWLLPWWNSNTKTTWITLDKVELKKRKSSSKKNVVFDILKRDLQNDTPQLTSNNFKSNKKYKLKQANETLKKLASNQNVSSLTLTYKKDSQLHALLINVKDIKRVVRDDYKDKLDDDVIYKVKGIFNNSDDAVFDTITDVRAIFNSTRKNRNVNIMNSYYRHPYNDSNESDYSDWSE